MASWIVDLCTDGGIMLSFNGFVVSFPWRLFSFSAVVAECLVCIIIILVNMILIWFYLLLLTAVSSFFRSLGSYYQQRAKVPHVPCLTQNSTHSIHTGQPWQKVE